MREKKFNHENKKKLKGKNPIIYLNRSYQHELIFTKEYFLTMPTERV